MDKPKTDGTKQNQTTYHRAAIYPTTPKFSTIGIGVSYLGLLGDYLFIRSIYACNWGLVNRSIHVLQTQETRKCAMSVTYIGMHILL
jgi:hypothetical protein